jgi:hypothetical protein
MMGVHLIIRASTRVVTRDMVVFLASCLFVVGWSEWLADDPHNTNTSTSDASGREHTTTTSGSGERSKTNSGPCRRSRATRRAGVDCVIGQAGARTTAVFARGGLDGVRAREQQARSTAATRLAALSS